MQRLMMKIGSGAMKILLRSRLHTLVSQNSLLITLTGCKTGRDYSLPVNYLQDGDTLYIISKRSRTWWRNLRGGKPVRVWLRGRQVDGTGLTDEKYATVLETLKNLFQNHPENSRYFGVCLESNNQPYGQDLGRLAQERVLVKVVLD